MRNANNTVAPTGLYPYQERDLHLLFEQLTNASGGARILYQLPTGGGKTRIFSEIAKWYIQQSRHKVMVLTHRVELCSQTATTLKKLDIKTKVINSAVKQLPKKQEHDCYVAMVETLRNRLKQGLLNPKSIGLVIIDEAHHNAFQKLLNKFPDAIVVGVTATPLSSNADLPMNKTYQQLIIGESIASLVKQGYLAKPVTWRYDVELNSLKTGIYGDFTISTSDELYSSKAMLDLLLHAYESHSKNKKTLIFNNGIFTSRAVCKMFEDAGYPVKHLDNRHAPAEREAILKWFKKTKGAILTSVSILTTGFDEPTVQTVILNRATTSLTLYHQMIGRGSRSLPKKKTFAIIDLGNNIDRFGAWQAPMDWQLIFDRPEAYIESLQYHTAQETKTVSISSELRSKFPNTLQLSFDVQEAHQRAVDAGQKSSIVIRDAIRQHALMCIENGESIAHALELADELDQEIQWRVKQYGKCLGKVTKNYTDWLIADYKSRLKTLVQKLMQRSLNSTKSKRKAA
ncbi:DEAD/DEAH box helicase family protein [Chitinophaga horti]|uniref:DEAD/DEAH box helicase family protein n=1 Tax=Chitinophaga horti TaxID=2920382 RepID=A0ABY6IVG3_9BACT|nr:DEAD/DEAH box helicase family protein [Chitinophaga horti]UYQ91213.1 DEAD/DEAH box helicase family protein [Chitinophaga horti]